MEPAPDEWMQGVFDDSDDEATVDKKGVSVEADSRPAKHRRPSQAPHVTNEAARVSAGAAEEYLIEPFSETVLVTEVIFRRDGRLPSRERSLRDRSRDGSHIAPRSEA